MKKLFHQHPPDHGDDFIDVAMRPNATILAIVLGFQEFWEERISIYGWLAEGLRSSWQHHKEDRGFLARHSQGQRCSSTLRPIPKSVKLKGLVGVVDTVL